MKKVGIVSCYYVKNYGSMLQAYAVQKLLDDKKIENENINFVKIKNGRQIFLYMKRLCDRNVRKVQLKILKKKIIGKLNKKKYGDNFNLRNKKFEEFSKKYIRTSHPYEGYEKLKDGAKNYKAFILGSDQVWNPDNFDNHYFTLEFIPKEIPKITYAPSFGVSSIPEKQREGTKKYLETLMIDKEKWDEIQPNNRLYDKKYIFCYFLGKNKEHREWVRKIKEKTGYTIIALPHIDEIVKCDDEYADIKMYDVGPAEMINLIKNAEIIFTDSFHCTAFSILYNKKFITFNRFKNKAKESTNTRIKSILSILELENRLVTDYEQCERIYNEEIDFEKPNERLKEMKDKSFGYFDNALKNSLNRGM